MSNLTLMVQGTTSDAGKTVVVAGLCRVLARHSQSVAPFKPQNMALNSAVTIEGGEIGRAQALQAQACFLDSRNDMNPVLIKPEADQTAQIIVHGKALKSMSAQGYHEFKQRALGYVMESYGRLKNEFDYIIVEGAGSPAEINLRDNDIANMGFAEEADCPVILVADIDRGGVFATVVGTLDLLSESERNRVVGIIINRFRGDIKLLHSGLEWLEQKVNKPVLGVLPYLKDFHLDAEDAINAQQILHESTHSKSLKVVVLVFPRISNHTDFDPLRLHPNVDLHYQSLSDPIGHCDLVILPGSKNVRADLAAFISKGRAKELDSHLRYGGKVLGICGGFQMLGSEVSDPGGIEGEPGSLKGLDLLSMTTVLKPSKVLKRQSGTLSLSNRAIEGYEIHCGETQGVALDSPFVHFDDGRVDGAISEDNQIIGSYLHGLFDSPEAVTEMLRWAGLESNHQVDVNSIRESELERLADAIEQHIEIETLFPESLSKELLDKKWSSSGVVRCVPWNA